MIEIYGQDGGFRVTSKQVSIGVDAPVKGNDCDLFTSPQQKPSDRLSFDGPGEYEVKNTLIDGVALGDKTGYVLSSEHLRAGLIPEGSDTDQLSDDQAEHFAELDVLVLPVEDDKAAKAIKLISQLEPIVVVPYGSSEAGLKHLQAEFGEKCSTEDRLRIAKKDVGEIQRLVCLKS